MKLFCLILYWWIPVIITVKTYSMYNIMTPNVNDGSQLIIMPQYRFTDCNKCVLHECEMLIIGETVCVCLVGEDKRVCGNFCTSHSAFLGYVALVLKVPSWSRMAAGAPAI